MTMRAMSADSHMDVFYLPKDAFHTRMDPAWGDRIPSVVPKDGAMVWLGERAARVPHRVTGQRRS